MNDVSSETLARLQLLVAAQGDSRLVEQAITKFGTAQLAAKAPALRSRLKAGLTADTSSIVDYEINAARKVGARIINGSDQSYPDALSSIDPVLFSIRGSWPSGPVVAIVGSRDADAYGLEIASTLGQVCAQSGVSVVSGAAHGIDAAALNATLDAGGTALAFLGFGIAHRAATVPSELLDRLLSVGTVISEFLPTARGSKTSYLARNRLIAALADVTIVVQAKVKSGSLNTAKHAKRLGRPVFAIPGDVGVAINEGSNHLISSGQAQMLTHLGTLGRMLGRPELKRARWPARFRAADSLRTLAENEPSRLDLTASERVLAAIERAGGALDRIQLAAAIASDLSVLDELLMELELEGYVGRDPAGRYTARRTKKG